MIRNRFTGILAAALTLAASFLHAQLAPSSIDHVKQLYESAAYDEALASLDRLGSKDATDRAVASKAWLEYRALCLLALDRTADAEPVIEQLLGQDPAYWPNPNDTSPRFVSVVDRARSRVLPLLARQQYESAKRDFDEKRSAQAAEGFARVVALLGNPALVRSAPGSGDDLRTLAAGFLELSKAAAAATPAPAVEKAPSRIATVYGAGDLDVTPPVTVRQDLPAWKHPAFGFVKRFEGQLDVIIDETGKVESATIVTSIFAGYDELAVAGAMQWQYAPATRHGIPVRFKKSVLVGLSVK
jgi:tetratricopeptide (TPR) repeat protein